MTEAHDYARVPLALASPSFLRDLTANLQRAGVIRAVRDRNTAAIFNCLMEVIQLQGISDAAAFAYSGQHGLPTFAGLESALRGGDCHRLNSYWHYHNCGYMKSSATCSEPDIMATCPVPRLPARNGRLSQAAVSLFLFIRDICDGDLVGWIDQRLMSVDSGSSNRASRMRGSLLIPLRNIFGVADKVLSMALADLLLVGDPTRERWVATGASMIAIDTLVHNYLHRTGAVRECGREHPYGPACYQLGGCAKFIARASAAFDARTVNSTFPANFPRFVQHAIWQFCATGGWDVCNGNRVNDRVGCQNWFCPAGSICRRVALHK